MNIDLVKNLLEDEGVDMLPGTPGTDIDLPEASKIQFKSIFPRKHFDKITRLDHGVIINRVSAKDNFGKLFFEEMALDDPYLLDRGQYVVILPKKAYDRVEMYKGEAEKYNVSYGKEIWETIRKNSIVAIKRSGKLELWKKGRLIKVDTIV